jgi:AcrR family transcriptional regulator
LNAFKIVLDEAPDSAYSCFEHVQNIMPTAQTTAKTTPKAQETQARVLETALELFRDEGFEKTTMRDIAAKAEVATGAAYYYYPSKDALIMAFYERSCGEMQPLIQAALDRNGGLEERLRAIIRVKLDYFAPNRGVLRGLLRTGADPKHPLSPFSSETQAIREIDLKWFRQILIDCGVRVPKDLLPHLPEVLWMFQMGVIYFWVTDDSADQARTARLLELGTRTLTGLLRFSALPLTRPLRKVAIELIELVKG